MSWEGVDLWRDEDGPRFTERDFDLLDLLERAEIGSDAYVAAEIAAGRSGEERDRP